MASAGVRFCLAKSARPSSRVVAESIAIAMPHSAMPGRPRRPAVSRSVDKSRLKPRDLRLGRIACESLAALATATEARLCAGESCWSLGDPGCGRQRRLTTQRPQGQKRKTADRKHVRHAFPHSLLSGAPLARRMHFAADGEDCANWGAGGMQKGQGPHLVRPRTRSDIPPEPRKRGGGGRKR
jgi:hypothetical protein